MVRLLGSKTKNPRVSRFLIAATCSQKTLGLSIFPLMHPVQILIWKYCVCSWA